MQCTFLVDKQADITLLKGKDFKVNHPVHVVPDSFHIPSDGIIGKDFLKRFE